MEIGLRLLNVAFAPIQVMVNNNNPYNWSTIMHDAIGADLLQGE